MTNCRWSSDTCIYHKWVVKWQIIKQTASKGAPNLVQNRPSLRLIEVSGIIFLQDFCVPLN